MNQNIEQVIGKTPIVQLNHIVPNGAGTILVKLENNNPAGSIKDRPVFYMIYGAENREEIHPGDTLIEATSGNTGIAMSMVAAIKGYRMILIMPDDMSIERRKIMKAYGADIILTPKDEGLERSRDLAEDMAIGGKGIILDQFNNLDNPRAHYEGTGPEIWNNTNGKISHFISAMGTTGTIMGTSKYLKEKNPAIKIIGVRPAEGAKIPGIRRWSPKYLPTIFEDKRVDHLMDINQKEAIDTTLRLATEEGIFCGISSGAAVAAAIKIAMINPNGILVTLIYDSGERYLSTGIF